MSNVIATTNRLLLREIEDGDQDYIYILSNEGSRLSKFPQDEEYISLHRKAHWEEVNALGNFNVMLFLKDTNDFVGKICMQHIDDPLPELGIDILKAHQNQGYGPEAIVAFCNWYSAEHKISEVKVRIRKENEHSIHVFEKLGAEHTSDTTYYPEEILNLLKEKIQGSDMSELFIKDVREYHLRLRKKIEQNSSVG